MVCVVEEALIDPIYNGVDEAQTLPGRALSDLYLITQCVCEWEFRQDTTHILHILPTGDPDI